MDDFNHQYQGTLIHPNPSSLAPTLHSLPRPLLLTTYSALVDRIAQCHTSEEIGTVAFDVARLTAGIGARVASWPQYDQRRARDKVANLLSMVERRRRHLEPHRFRFVGDPIPPPSSPSVLVEKPTVPLTSAGHVVTDIVNSQRTIDAPQEHVWIRHVTRSRVAVTAASIHVHQADLSVFTIDVAGPIFLHHFDHCVIDIRHAHQVRLHHLTTVLVIVNDASLRTLTMEKCRDVYVASDNRNVSVDDFDWPRRDVVNPHWHAVTTNDISAITTAMARNSKDMEEYVLAIIGMVADGDNSANTNDTTNNSELGDQ